MLFDGLCDPEGRCASAPTRKDCHGPIDDPKGRLERITAVKARCFGFLPHGGVKWRDHPQIEAWLGRITPLPPCTHAYELIPGQPLPKRG